MAGDRNSESSSELNSSVLGTKEHWDQTYKKELYNFLDHGDIGDVWFGEESMERVIKWMSRSSLIKEDSAVLDLGCGNGALMVEMHKHGYKNLTGVDYSQAAVDLAIAIAKEKSANVVYERADILADSPLAPCLQKQYDVCIDKGTYDAISLCPEDPSGKRAAYIRNVLRFLNHQGLLFITSCNWTEAELLKHFCNDFIRHSKIPTPTFTFGGVTGNRESTLVLMKKDCL